MNRCTFVSQLIRWLRVLRSKMEARSCEKEWDGVRTTKGNDKARL